MPCLLLRDVSVQQQHDARPPAPGRAPTTVAGVVAQSRAEAAALQRARDEEQGRQQDK
eukprot:gene25687-63246_t